MVLPKFSKRIAVFHQHVDNYLYYGKYDKRSNALNAYAVLVSIFSALFNSAALLVIYRCAS